MFQVSGLAPKWLEILKPEGGETSYQDSLASYYFTLSHLTGSDSIVVDMGGFNLGATYKTVSTNGFYRPGWRGPAVINNPGYSSSDF